jgi:uncharacterized protein (TIGR02453 family)
LGFHVIIARVYELLYRRVFEILSGFGKTQRKKWFDANKAWYENDVKEPFTAFVEEMIARIRAKDPEVAISAKDAIFRINRDIRFSKDKRPYKTHMAANISAAGRRSHEEPGFYFQFGPKTLMIAGGAYMVETGNIHKIRRAIADDLEKFDSLLKEKEFKKKYGTLQGEQNKVMPPEFKEPALKQPLLSNKQFYYMAELGADAILKKKPCGDDDAILPRRQADE